MTSKSKRIVVVGGVAGGASAAARARRLSEDAEIVIFERGEHISFANCGLPYHIGGTIPLRERLLIQTPESMAKRFRVKVRVNHEVLRIHRESREVAVRDRVSGDEYRESYDSLILSPGAAPIRPPIPGIDSSRVLTLRSMNDMDAIIRLIVSKPASRALVVGGGYIGLEVTEALRYRGVSVTLVELAEQVMGVIDPEMASLLHQELRSQGVDLRLKTSVVGFAERGEKLDVSLSSQELLPCDFAILAIGVKPEIKLALEAGLQIGSRNGIVVDEQMRTSDPDIFAVGDAVEIRNFVTQKNAVIPLAGPANRQGRIAADNIFGRNRYYKSTQGTAICKLFNLTIAMTGVNETTLKREGRLYQKIYLHPANHASYYPDASSISLKLLFEAKEGKILGAQAVGEEGVDKRIDILAMAQRLGATVYDLEEAELCYAPPYGSAKDPVNYAGFIAANILKGDLKICHSEDLLTRSDDRILVDVRDADEVSRGMIEGSIHIPLDELRDRLDEIDRNKEVITICEVGLRSYLAYRILTQRGYRCRNLSGGYRTYLMTIGKPS
ncbi:MAG: FAD-dependent oxidoreductase [Deltaproteobacteria bacterium]|nr:FAD-dependent oxidoreductase [Deltaproteobacteria bacterium]